MNKKNLWIAIGAVVVVAIIVGVWYSQSQKSSLSDEEQALDDLNSALDASAELPSTDFSTNPVKNLPDTNPADKTNPYKNLETNPFK